MTGSRRPVVIIGAPRSGTNMLRDAISALPRFATWPCDEINLIWRHGNVHEPSDEFTRAHARPEIRAFIRRAFDRIGRRQRAASIVEKTCANSLRVDFVDAVLPDARFVYIVRDGRDASISAARRWRGGIDFAYTLRKARYVPPSDLPLYLRGFLSNRVHRLASKERRLGSWGPRFRDIDVALKELSLLEVCALQWKRCVDLSDVQLSKIQSERVYRLSYERFVQDPAEQLQQMIVALGETARSDEISAAVTGVTEANAGKWKTETSAEESVTLEALLAEPLARHGYLTVP